MANNDDAASLLMMIGTNVVVDDGEVWYVDKSAAAAILAANPVKAALDARKLAPDRFWRLKLGTLSVVFSLDDAAIMFPVEGLNKLAGAPAGAKIFAIKKEAWPFGFDRVASFGGVPDYLDSAKVPKDAEALLSCLTMLEAIENVPAYSGHQLYLSFPEVRVPLIDSLY